MITVIQFDFAGRQESAIPADGIAQALAAGHFCWVDMDFSAAPDQDSPARECEACLKALGVNELARQELMGVFREGRYDVYEDCLHFAMAEALVRDGRLQNAHLDVVIGMQYMITFRRHPVDLIARVKRVYREDFRKFAQSPGFLLYEMADHLTDAYCSAVRDFTTMVEQVQLKLFGEIDDGIFRQVAAITQDILGLRKAITAARELFHKLGTRRSPFVSATTQPFLENMAGAMERLSDDLIAEREELNETLNLYMGMVSHRTNKVINRLTVISAVFLPLTFICGVYGVNLQGVPEFGWQRGYLFFWALCLVVAVAQIVYMRRRKWL